MEITAVNAEAEVDDIVDLVEMQDVTDYLGFTDLTGSLAFSVQSVGEAVMTGDMSRMNIEGLLPVTMGFCPEITYPDIPAGGTFPNPYTIMIDYGTGCIPPGQSETYSGSMSFSLSNLGVSYNNNIVTISANYALTFNALTTEESVLDGSVSGRLSITSDLGGSTFSGNLLANFNNLSDGEETLNGTISASLTDILVDDFTNQLSGTVAVAFSNFSDGTDTLNGSISAVLDINTVTELGTITFNYFNFTDGSETLAGTLTATMTDTTTTLVYALSTSSGPINMTIEAVEDDIAGTTTINTIGTGTYHGVSITITNVVIDDTCSLSPVSGTIVLTDATTTATTTFNGCGVIDVNISP
jgi:hypothetical protein